MILLGLLSEPNNDLLKEFDSGVCCDLLMVTTFKELCYWGRRSDRIIFVRKLYNTGPDAGSVDSLLVYIVITNSCASGAWCRKGRFWQHSNHESAPCQIHLLKPRTRACPPRKSFFSDEQQQTANLFSGRTIRRVDCEAEERDGKGDKKKGAGQIRGARR